MKSTRSRRTSSDLIGVTTVYVTHDQSEAMTLSTRLAVMRGGGLQQVGRPDEVYSQPANVFRSDRRHHGVCDARSIGSDDSIDAARRHAWRSVAAGWPSR